MSIRRLIPSIALLTALQACAPGAVPVAPGAPTASAVPTDVAQAMPASTPEPLPAVSLAGAASLFELPMAGAEVRIGRIGEAEAIATATTAPDGTFTATLPAGVAAGQALLVTATKDGQTVTTLYQAPQSAFAVAQAPALALDADTSAAYGLVASRLVACLKAGGDAAQSAADAYRALASALKGLAKSNLEEAVKRELLSAPRPDGTLPLSEAARRTLGYRANAAQRTAFTQAAERLAAAIVLALKVPGVVIPAEALAALGFGPISADAVSTRGSSGGGSSGGPTNHRTATVDIVGPEDSHFNLNTDPLSASGPDADALTRTYSTPGWISDMAVDALGATWTVNTGGGCVTRIAPDGSIRRTFDVYGNKIAVDGDGTAWVSDGNNHQVHRIAADGTHTAIDLLPAEFPYGVTIGQDDVFVAVSSNDGAYAVVRLSADGSQIERHPTTGAPYNVAVDAWGRIWATIPNAGTVALLGPDGQVQGTYVSASGARALALDPFGNAWVVNQFSNSVTRVSPDGRTRQTFSTGGTMPDHIAVDALGNAWITNNAAGSNVIARISARGEVQHIASRPGPRGVAVDARGRAWVANHDDDSVSVYSPAGQELANYRVLEDPATVCVDAQGHVWVGNDSTGGVVRLSY